MNQDCKKFEEIKEVAVVSMKHSWKPLVEPLSRPLVEETPKIELKPLPRHLKYVYLGLSKILSIIISAHLDPTQEEELLIVLRENQKALGGIMTDIKGISPSIVQHQIHLGEDAKPTRDP